MLKDKFNFKASGNRYIRSARRTDFGYTITWKEGKLEYNIAYTEQEVEGCIASHQWEVVDDVKEETQAEPIYKALDFNELTGRRFGVSFKRISDVKYKTPIQNINLRYIEGNIETFAPMGSVVLNDREYGFNIIPYQLIVEMTEIFEVEDKV